MHRNWSHHRRDGDLWISKWDVSVEETSQSDLSVCMPCSCKKCSASNAAIHPGTMPIVYSNNDHNQAEQK